MNEYWQFPKPDILKRIGFPCSFCSSNHEDDGVYIIAGPGVYICSECVELCNEVLAEQNKKSHNAVGF